MANEIPIARGAFCGERGVDGLEEWRRHLSRRHRRLFALSGIRAIFSPNAVCAACSSSSCPPRSLCLALASPIYLGALTRTWSRIAAVNSDASAQARFSSFGFGFELFAEQPVFGVGYNYLLDYAQEVRGLTSLDSSLQVILVNFGAVGTLFIAGLVFWWGVTLWRRLSNMQTDTVFRLPLHPLFPDLPRGDHRVHQSVQQRAVLSVLALSGSRTWQLI